MLLNMVIWSHDYYTEHFCTKLVLTERLFQNEIRAVVVSVLLFHPIFTVPVHNTQVSFVKKESKQKEVQVGQDTQVVQWLWGEADDQEVVSSNPGTRPDTRCYHLCTLICSRLYPLFFKRLKNRNVIETVMSYFRKLYFVVTVCGN